MYETFSEKSKVKETFLNYLENLISGKEDLIDDCVVLNDLINDTFLSDFELKFIDKVVYKGLNYMCVCKCLNLDGVEFCKVLDSLCNKIIETNNNQWYNLFKKHEK